MVQPEDNELKRFNDHLTLAIEILGKGKTNMFLGATNTSSSQYYTWKKRGYLSPKKAIIIEHMTYGAIKAMDLFPPYAFDNYDRECA